MKALLCEIWVCLLIAFLLGALVGWLLKCLCCKKKLERLEHDNEAKLAKASVDMSTASASTSSAVEASVNTAMSAPDVEVSAPSTAPVGLLSAEPTDKDDLKRVSGIGPVFERVLNGLGVYKFEQIANFDEENIQWVAEHIDTFPDRIYTDRWVEQAAELAKEVANK